MKLLFRDSFPLAAVVNIGLRKGHQVMTLTLRSYVL